MANGGQKGVFRDEITKIEIKVSIGELFLNHILRIPNV